MGFKPVAERRPKFNRHILRGWSQLIGFGLEEGERGGEGKGWAGGGGKLFETDMGL